jgi:signal peptidase I
VQRYHGRRAVARRSRRRFLAELPFLLVAAVILTILVKGFLIQAFFIPSRSMEPTLDVGDRVVVNRLAYRLGDPAHGQVVVFLRPTATGQDPPRGPLSWARRAVAQGLGGTPPGSEDLIKRVVGLPGDVIEGRDGYLWRNGRSVDEPYLRDRTSTSEFPPVRVKPDHFWVMGDNREDSADSRVFGQVHRSALVGRAVLTVWPVPHVGGL